MSGAHATPSQMAERYGERWCRQGALGLRPTKDLMAFLLANADRLAKYGA